MTHNALLCRFCGRPYQRVHLSPAFDYCNACSPERQQAAREHFYGGWEPQRADIGGGYVVARGANEASALGIPEEDQAAHRAIKHQLANIERTHGVRIVYAVESGSRAWGFASADSDQDVRFLYLRAPEWYLTVNVERKRDVIGLPLQDNLDINGWDLRKALRLLRKSNPPLLEWLGSPIVYREHYSVARRMRALLPLCYSPRAAMYHYYHMARGNVREYLKGERAGEEMDEGPRIPALHDFLDSELARLEQGLSQVNAQQCPVETLDGLFQLALAEVWG